jgi:hypothetical protein
MSVSDLLSIGLSYQGISILSNPFITVYTNFVPNEVNASSWYQSKRTYEIANSSTLSSAKNYIAAYNFINPSVPGLRQYAHTHVALNYTADTASNKGSFGPNEKIMFFSIGSNSGAAINNVEFILSSLKIKSTFGTQCFMFNNTDIKVRKLFENLFHTANPAL